MSISISKVALGLLRTTRPRQWSKNVFVVAPLVFAKNLFHYAVFTRAIAAFFVFNFLAGAVYTLNDLIDVEADRRHPTKCKRPIAAGDVPIGVARAAFFVLAFTALGGAALLGVGVLACAAGYIANNLAYSFRIKHVPYLDVGSIALGFVVRVVAGAIAVDVQPSAYLILCTALLAMFLGFGKRRHELKAHASSARAVLDGYNLRALDVMMVATGLATVGAYVMYTLDTTTAAFFGTRYLWLTTPFVMIAMSIFVRLVRDESRPDSPTDEMLRNVPFVLTLVLYAATIITLVYFLRPT